MKRKQSKYGLTLVEILVAVVIIAILAAGLYSVGNYLETQSRIRLTQSTIEILSAAIEQYHDFNDSFPFIADPNKTYGITDLELDVGGNVVNPADHNDTYSSSEALYYFLNKFPAGRKIVGSINRSLLTNKGDNGREYFIDISGQRYPLIHIIDPWKYPLRYTYYYDRVRKQGDNFPVITSAGPDKIFGDDDDISSRK